MIEQDAYIGVIDKFLATSDNLLNMTRISEAPFPF